MSMQTFKKLPGVLSFQRGLMVSDGRMLNVMPDGTTSPVNVFRHGIRGTQNIPITTDASSKGGKREVANIQTTESALLHPDAVALEVRFSLRPLAISQVLSACAGDSQATTQAVRGSITNFLDRAKGEAVAKLSLRYARTTLNARWLWRNRVSAATVKTSANVVNGASLAVVDSLSLPMNSFDAFIDAERSLAKVIAENFCGESMVGIEVVARVDFAMRGSIEVFPSQNYIENKPKGFARPLYKIGGTLPYQRKDNVDSVIVGHAGLRDQKIGNALRTIDTWYPTYPELKQALPVEPMAASLDLMDFLRDGPHTAFKLFCRLNELDPASDEGQFALACMIRGGVYSESDKPTDKKDASAQPVATTDEAD